MAQQKRVNKNMVGGLTVGGMVVTLVIVLVATVNAAQRDPEKLAQRAEEALKGGNSKRAIELFRNAFRARKEARYLVRASQVAYGMGEFGDSLNMLRVAEAQEPDNPDMKQALLERYWELSEFGWRVGTDLREAAEKLLAKKPDSLLGLICEAQALSWLSDQDAALAPKAEEAIRKALELGPNDWRLALVRSSNVIRAGLEEARAKMRARDLPAAQALREKAIESAAGILRAACAANKDQPRLVLELARLLRELKKRDEALQLLENAVTEMPRSAEVRLALARTIFEDQLAETSAAPAADADAALARAAKLAQESIQLEPAMYDAYRLYAQLKQMQARSQGRWEKERLAAQKDVLDTFVLAQEATLKLKSLRAVLGDGQRAQMIAGGFELALNFAQPGSGGGDAERKDALAYAKRFRNDMSSQYPETVFVPMMDGRLAILEEDWTKAIKAYSEAEAKCREIPVYSKECKEQLAVLYTRTNTPGLALKFTDEALQIAQQNGLSQPVWLQLNRAGLLIQVDRAREALDLIDSLQPLPDDRERRSLRAKALALLGRGGEAEAELKRNVESGASDTALLDEARLAAYQNDYPKAEDKARAALEKNPRNLQALRVYAQCVTLNKHQAEGLEFLKKTSEGATETDVKAAYQTYAVILSARDEAERDQQLLELIGKTPDPCDRAAEFYNFYSAKQDLEKAQGYADELEKCRPDDPETLELQFALAVRRQKFERAEEYAGKLAKKNADHASGAIFRGQLKLARGDADGALTDFRVAERELPTDVDLKVRIAEALLRTKPPRSEDAITVLRTAVEYNPRHFAANRLLYACCEQAGRRDDGIEFLERAASQNPNDEYVKDRMRVVAEGKDPARGIASREQRRQEKPDDLDNTVRLVELYDKLGTEEACGKAEQLLRASAEAGVQAHQLWIAGAKYYARRGKRTEGEKFLRDVIEKQTGGLKLDAQLMLGRFYEQLGDGAAAQTTFQETQRKIDETVGDDAKLRQRGRVAVAVAMAEFYDRARQAAEMINEYKTALKALGPDEQSMIQDVKLKIIKGHMMSEQFVEAGKQIEAYQKEYPKDPRGEMARVELVLRNKPDEKALADAKATTTRVLAEQPDNVWCLYWRARISIALGNDNEARADLQRCKSVQPKAFNYEPRNELARLLERRNELALAEAELREVATEQAQNPQAWMSLVLFLTRTDQVDRAIQVVGQLISQFPEEAFWHYQQGLLLARKEEYSAAVTEFEAAMKLTKGPPRPELVEAYVNALVKTARFREVAKVVEGLKSDSISPRVRTSLAEALIKLNQREKAIEQVEIGIGEASLKHSDEVAAVAELATVQIGEAETIACLRRVLEKVAGERAAAGRVKLVLGRQLAIGTDAGKRAEGLKLADEVIAAAQPKSRLAVSALIVRGLALDAASDYENSRKAYEEALKISPDDITALNNLAYLLADRLGKPQDALRYAQYAAQLAPGNANVLDTLGWIQMKCGQLDPAEGSLRDALRADDELLAAREHLAEVFAARGNSAEARKLLEAVTEKARKLNRTDVVERTQKRLSQLK